MISGVMLVHNEERYLPYSLNSLKYAPLDELIVVLDNCSDQSENILKKAVLVNEKVYPYWFKPTQEWRTCVKRDNLEIKTYRKNNSSWKNKIAEATEYGFSKANGDIIFLLEADKVFDLANFDDETFNLLKQYGMVSFQSINADKTVNPIRRAYYNILRRIYQLLSHNKLWDGGIFVTKKELWQQLHFRDVKSTFGEHNQFIDYKERLEKHGYKWICRYDVNNYHLKENVFTKKWQLNEGKIRRKKKYPLWRVLIHSFLHFKPYVFVGYWRQK